MNITLIRFVGFVRLTQSVGCMLSTLCYVIQYVIE